MNKKIKDYTGQEFVITREFDAPRELVFKAWIEPARLAQWWDPCGCGYRLCDHCVQRHSCACQSTAGFSHPSGLRLFMKTLNHCALAQRS